MAVEVEFKNTGRKRGLGIRPGVNVLIGGGFHGKSTLLDALVKGIYPHIPGDGREQVVTHPDAAFICAEDGRAITGLDISGFIDNLPGKVDAKRFWTTNASGSTSEAAAIIEAVLANAKLLYDRRGFVRHQFSDQRPSYAQADTDRYHHPPF